MIAAPNHGQRWTSQADKQLCELLAARTPVDEVAQALGRTVAAVVERHVVIKAQRSITSQNGLFRRATSRQAR